MSRYGASARDRYATTVLSLLLAALVVITLGVLAHHIAGTVTGPLQQTGATR